MSDIKFCDSCGNKISITALFCPKCGQKQEPILVPEAAAPTESMEQNSDNETQVVNEEQVIDESANKEEQIINDESINDKEAVTETELVDFNVESNNEDVKEPAAEPISENDTPVESEIPLEQHQQNTYTPQPQPMQQTIHQTQPVQQPQPQYQQSYYHPNVQTPGVQQPQTEGVKKKKFPWVFSVLWIILLVAVGIWAYFLLVDPNYDYPRFTEDAQRIALFTAAIAALIYTLSLKLTMRKIKALPTVILVILALVGFYFFCMVELQDGDLLHDAVSKIVESIIP